VVGPDGETIARAAQFEPELLVCDLTLPGGGKAPARIAEPLPSEEAEVYAALKLGLRDYVEKNAFDHVVIALSGGIDSALVALVAVDALGADQVSVVVMPSPNSSDATQSDARSIAANLGVELIEISIAESMESYERALAQSFEGTEPGIAEENLQARIRGNLVMALSNKFGWLVLTTGNKSELSVGYATLYGDMAGGFAVIKDIFKLLVYPAGRGLPPSLRDPRPDPGGLRRARRGHRRARRPGPAGGPRHGCHPPGRSRRVQAPPGAARDPRLDQGVRPGPPPAHHEPVRLDAAAAPLGALRPDGDRHTGQGADAALVVGHLDIPDPSSPALVARFSRGVDVPLADRAQERGVIRLAHRDHAVIADGVIGARGADALGERGVDAAVDDSVHLKMALLNRDPGAGVVGIEVDPFDSDLVREARRDCLLLAHGAGP
jgi:NAD+ synthetase